MGRAVHPHIITPDSALGGFDIKRSVRCGNGGGFTRTQTATGNQKVWTWSAWVKRNGHYGDRQVLFCGRPESSNYCQIEFDGDDNLKGDSGKDKLYVQDGDDYLDGAKSKDKIYGGIIDSQHQRN